MGCSGFSTEQSLTTTTWGMKPSHASNPDSCRTRAAARRTTLRGRDQARYLADMHNIARMMATAVALKSIGYGHHIGHQDIGSIPGDILLAVRK